MCDWIFKPMFSILACINLSGSFYITWSFYFKFFKKLLTLFSTGDVSYCSSSSKSKEFQFFYVFVNTCDFLFSCPLHGSHIKWHLIRDFPVYFSISHVIYLFRKCIFSSEKCILKFLAHLIYLLFF